MTTPRFPLLALAAAVAVAAAATAPRLAAQSLQLPDGSGRLLRLFDLAPLLAQAAGPDLRLSIEPEPAAPAAPVAPAAPAADAGEAVEFGGGAARAAAPAPVVVRDPGRVAVRADLWPTDDATALGRQLAGLVEPPLGDGDDCQVFAGRWLAVLASAEQIASVDRLLRLAADQRGRTLDVEVRLLHVAHERFTNALQPQLASVKRGDRESFEAVLAANDAGAFAAAAKTAATGEIEVPKLSVGPLQRATGWRKEQTAYIRDFTVHAADGAMIADPVIDSAWDGVEAEVFTAPRADGTYTVAVSVAQQQLDKPIAQLETTVPGTKLPLKVQLPRVRGVRLQQTAVLAPGALAVTAARRADGTWLVALVRATPRAASRPK
jgi:hypothetical protein